MREVKRTANSFEELRRKAESLLQEQSVDSSQYSRQIPELIKELQIYHAELEIQNEELKRSQEELSNLYREYEKLYEFAPCAYITLSPPYGFINRCNLTGTTLLGIERSNLIRKSLPGFMIWKSREAFFTALQEARESGEQRNEELELIREDGTSLWAWAYIRVETSQDEAGEEWQVVLVDITARKQSEEAVRKSEQRYSALIKVSAQVVFRVGPNWTEVQQLTGEDFFGDSDKSVRNWLEKYIPLDEQERVLDAVTRAIKEEKALELEHKVRRIDGTIGWSYTRAVPIRNDAGEIEEWFGAATDMTVRKQAEEALRLSEARFRALIEGSPDAVLIIVDQTVVYLNAAAVSLFGADSKEQMLGQSVLEYVQPTNRSVDKERLKLVSEYEMQLTELEDVFLRMDGSEVQVEYSGVPIIYNNQQGAVIFVRDITERRQMEQLREDVDRITRHDLKTPLNGILGLPQTLLSDQNLTQEQRELLEYIQSSGRRMLDTVNMSLSLYQMEKGEYEFRPRPVDLVPIIRDIEKDLMKSFRNQNSKLVLSIVSEKDNNDSFWVSGEKLLCYTMLSNLIKNAVESLQYGEEVHVYLEKTSSSQARICIHNPGVIPEQIQKSFGQKYTTSGKKQGTGLGVYSARLIANTMNGSFDWSTSRESGTCVIINLPD